MRVTIVSSKDLDMRDWRPEHYMPTKPTDLVAAKLAGWAGGSSGHEINLKSQWLKHGKEEVRKAYLEGRVAGVQARDEFLRTHVDE
jgi:hypothetical protein